MSTTDKPPIEIPQTIPIEEWRPIITRHVLACNYEVSNLGRVRNADSGNLLTTFIMKRPNGKDGYSAVSLYRVGSPARVHMLAGLVAAAFLGPKPPGYQVNHKDGIKANNTVTNLEYITQSENIQHAYSTGLNSSEKITKPRRFCTQEEYDEIFRLWAGGKGLSQVQIGEQLDLDNSAISKIVNGKCKCVVRKSRWVQPPRVWERLQDLMDSLPAGTQITKRQAVWRLNVSITAVWLAAKQLERAGVLRVIVGNGCPTVFERA